MPRIVVSGTVERGYLLGRQIIDLTKSLTSYSACYAHAILQNFRVNCAGPIIRDLRLELKATYKSSSCSTAILASAVYLPTETPVGACSSS
jgi:hypothetical protein